MPASISISLPPADRPVSERASELADEMQVSYDLTHRGLHRMSVISSNSDGQGDMSIRDVHKESQQDGSSSPVSPLSSYCYGASCCIQPRLSIKVPSRTGSPLNSWRDKSEELESGSPALHNQVMRLRREDQQLAEDIIEVLDAPKERLIMNHLSYQVSDMLVSTPRAVSPSPLGMRTKSWPPDAWDSPTLARATHGSFS